MSKKISFKRPDKPVPREADAWVSASDEAPPPATAPARPVAKPAARAATRKTSRRPAPDPKPGGGRATAGAPAPSVSLSNARWVDHMLASVDRQSDMVLRRAAALSLDSAEGETAASLLASMDARAQAVIDRMKALQNKVRSGSAPSPSKP